MKLDSYEVFEIIGLDGFLFKNFPQVARTQSSPISLIQQLSKPSDAMKA